MKDTIQGYKATLSAGIEKVASDIPADQHQVFIEKCAEEFERLITITGMDKEAGFDAGGLGQSLATAGLTALGGLAFNKVRKGFGDSANRTAYERALETAIARSEILTAADQDKIRRMADSIYSFAPKVASDANVLTNILVNASYMDSLDLQTVKAVTELEEKLNKMA